MFPGIVAEVGIVCTFWSHRMVSATEKTESPPACECGAHPDFRRQIPVVNTTLVGQVTVAAWQESPDHTSEAWQLKVRMTYMQMVSGDMAIETRREPCFGDEAKRNARHAVMVADAIKAAAIMDTAVCMYGEFLAGKRAIGGGK